jgi:hypothetical protein
MASAVATPQGRRAEGNEMPHRQVGRILLTILLVVCAIWLGRSAQFYNEALVSIFFAATLTGANVIHFRVHPTREDALLVLCGASLLAAIDFQLLHYKPTLAAWLSFAGLSSLVVLGARTIWAEGSARKFLALGFVPAALLVGSEYIASTFLEWTAAAHPKVLDLYLYSFDASLGTQLPFLVGRAFVRWPYLRLASLISYVGLGIPIALIYAGRLLRLGEKAVPSFVAFLATGPMGVIFYNMFPALGPVHLFHARFPQDPIPTAQVSRLYLEPVKLFGPPNAIPSLHMAWALLVWWYSRGLSWWERGVAFGFLVFTVLATLGTGEHYFVDLVVAFPFAVLVEAIWSFDFPWNDKLRVRAVVGGLMGTLSWLAALRYALRFFWLSSVLPWALCGCTTAFSFVLERQLHRQVEGAGTRRSPLPSVSPNGT